MVINQRYLQQALTGLLTCLFVMASTTAQASNNWDGSGGSNWWFDPINWGHDGGCSMGIDPCYLPPIQDSGGIAVRNDSQINAGTGEWDITGEGVVYDPENDPFFGAAADLTYVTGSPLATTAGVMRDYGPETLYRLYISRNTTNDNLVTIKSGDLVIESTTIIGRSGSTGTSPAEQNLGMVVQTGGSVRLPLTGLDLGNRETSGWGNGTWDYQGGILEVSELGGSGLRLSGSSGAGTAGHGRFIMHNPDTPGHVRAFDVVFAANDADGDGVTTGVGIAEFHYENGGTMPMQVSRNLSINNGVSDNLTGMRSARLELVLGEAPVVDGGGVPNNLGLFDVDFDQLDFEVGTITGTGDLDGDSVFNNDRVFSNADASAAYRQGDTVSALFGGTRYDWTISYTGTITWSDPDAGLVQSVEDNGFDTDVVLIGLGSEVVGPVGVAGDYNDDGVVNAADYVLWRNADPNDVLANEGASIGMTDQADYDFWVSQFGNTSGQGGASSAVPEPTSCLLLLISATIAVLGVRKSR